MKTAAGDGLFRGAAKKEKGVRLKILVTPGNKSKGSAVYRESWQERSVVDQADFATVVMPHLDEAYNLARWLTGSAADAEDVVQESLMKAFRFFAGFRGPRPGPGC